MLFFMDARDNDFRERGLTKMLEFLKTEGTDLRDETLVYLGRLTTLESEPEVITTTIRGDRSFPNHRCIVHTKENISAERAATLLQKAGFVPFLRVGGSDGYINYLIGNERSSTYIEFMSEAYSNRETQLAIPLSALKVEE